MVPAVENLLSHRATNPFGDSTMFRSHQAAGPVIRVRNQATIRVGGEQGRTAVSDSFVTGSRACGLSCERTGP